MQKYVFFIGIDMSKRWFDAALCWADQEGKKPCKRFDNLTEGFEEFHQWATTNRPTAYDELFSKDGAFVYNRGNAEKVLVLLEDWRNE